MEIKARTLLDKIYDNRLPLGFALVMILAVITTVSIKISEHYEMEAKELASIAHEAKKVELIEEHKPDLVCNGVLLIGMEYDLSMLNNDYQIITNETIGQPIKSIPIKNCKIWTKLTKTMVIKPKVIIPIDVQHEKAIKALTTELILTTKNYEHVMTENKVYVDTLKKANIDINALNTFIVNQDKELDRLILIEAKFKQIDGLLEIVLNKKSLTVKDLVIKPIVPKKKKVVITKHIKDIKPLRVEVKKPEIVTIKNQKDHMQRILYTIRYLSQSMRGNAEKIVPSPTKRDLDRFNISNSQIKNFANVSKQLMSVIERLSGAHTRNNNIIDNSLRLSITENVGI